MVLGERAFRELPPGARTRLELSRPIPRPGTTVAKQATCRPFLAGLEGRSSRQIFPTSFTDPYWDTMG